MITKKDWSTATNQEVEHEYELCCQIIHGHTWCCKDTGEKIVFKGLEDEGRGHNCNQETFENAVRAWKLRMTRIQDEVLRRQLLIGE